MCRGQEGEGEGGGGGDSIKNSGGSTTTVGKARYHILHDFYQYFTCLSLPALPPGGILLRGIPRRGVGHRARRHNVRELWRGSIPSGKEWSSRMKNSFLRWYADIAKVEWPVSDCCHRRKGNGFRLICVSGPGAGALEREAGESLEVGLVPDTLLPH